MQLIENNIYSYHGAHPTPWVVLSRHAAYSPEEVLVSLWIKELHYVNNSSSNKGMIQPTTCYGNRKDVRARSH